MVYLTFTEIIFLEYMQINLDDERLLTYQEIGFYIICLICKMKHFM